MNRKFLLCIVISALVLLAWIFWPRLINQKVVSEQTNETPALPLKEITKQRPEAVQPQIISASSRTNPPVNRDDAKRSRAESWKQEIESKNIPFDFYGKVVDQNSNSLSGVGIRVRVRHWQVGSTGSIPLDRQTDADGRFDIHGITGDAFDIEGFGKSGYELEPGRRGYDAIGGTYNNPVVFKMWNTNAHERLTTGDKRFHVTPDGRPYFIDLMNGTIAESGQGDVKVWIRYSLATTNAQLYDWSAKIDMLNGGLLEEGDLNSAMYVAPSNGYVPSFESQQQIKTGQSGSTGSKRFYIMLNNGQIYGRMTIDLIAPFNGQVPGLIRLSYAINPSGSTTLR